jgi:hypothetical protein
MPFQADHQEDDKDTPTEAEKLQQDREIPVTTNQNI